MMNVMGTYRQPIIVSESLTIRPVRVDILAPHTLQ